MRKNLQSRNLVEYHELVDSATPTGGNYFSIHRSLQLIVLDFLAEDSFPGRLKLQHYFDEAVALICRQLPRPSPYMVPLYHN